MGCPTLELGSCRLSNADSFSRLQIAARSLLTLPVSEPAVGLLLLFEKLSLQAEQKISSLPGANMSQKQKNHSSKTVLALETHTEPQPPGIIFG